MSSLLTRVGSVRGDRGRVLGVVLVALAVVLAIQLPRLLGDTDLAEVGSPAVVVVAAPEQPAADLTAAVEAAPVSAGADQLDSPTPVVPKDPFVQQIVADPTGADESAAAGAVVALPGTPSPVAALRFATIAVNGVEERLAVDGLFPLGQPLFVLAGLDARSARIGIASEGPARGTFATLELGRILTLEDAATGARYRLELLYLGDAPEQTRRFVTGQGLRAVAAAN